ncbi:hypothetical protein Tco_0929163 [Tanacetum coccineum]
MDSWTMGEVQILSQLDMLRDANEVVHDRSHFSLLQKRQADMCVEDDVEFPIFANNDEFTFTPEKASAYHSYEEILSDDEGRGNCMQLSKCFTVETDDYQKCEPSSFGGNRKDGICTWLAENAEADALVNVHDNADFAQFHSLSARAKRSGGKDKARHKFSFRRQSHPDLFRDITHVVESDTSLKGKDVDDMKNHVMPAEIPVSHTHTTTSMAELLVRVQDEPDLPEGSIIEYNETKGTSRQLAVKRSIPSQDHSDIDDDLDCLRSDSSEEDEYNHQALELAMPESKQKTIADQFHEALGAASTNDEEHMYAVPRNTGVGLFGKLQRVMHREKERDSYFLNKLPSEDEASCFDVKIMSRSLEGKLIVCSCSSIENDETSTNTNSPQNVVKRKQMTIIFSSRICSDVELDVGTLVRIHPPWKEVNVKGKEDTLCVSIEVDTENGFEIKDMSGWSSNQATKLLGVADALAYLHHDCLPYIKH